MATASATRAVPEALSALEGEASPFKDPARAADMKERLGRVKRQAESGTLVERFAAKVEALARRVNGPDLGERLPEVQDLAAPQLPGKHALAEEHARRVAQLEARRVRIQAVAETFAGMVWIKKSAKGSLYMEPKEVTNADFAKLVQSGGYSNPMLWPEEVLPNVLQFTDFFVCCF